MKRQEKKTHDKKDSRIIQILNLGENEMLGGVHLWWTQECSEPERA